VVTWPLWTIPYELLCYTVISVLMVPGAPGKPATVLAFAGSWLCLTAFAAAYAGTPVRDESGKPMSYGRAAPGERNQPLPGYEGQPCADAAARARSASPARAPGSRSGTIQRLS
jgi:hypothetical protein